MHNYYFDTNEFQDADEKLKENFNEIGGFSLCRFLQATLNNAGFQNEEIFAEDYGWAFVSKFNGIEYFCSASVDPADEGDNSGYSHFANLNIERKRSFFEKLTGKNKMTSNDPASEAIHSALMANKDVKNLKSFLP